MTLHVSIVVPTYRRPHLLDRCLTALCAQDLGADAYEIIVADDGNDARTRQLVAARAHATGDRPTIRYVAVTERHGPAAARNAGAWAARAEVIAFTDDDCVPEPDWLRSGLAALEADAPTLTFSAPLPAPQKSPGEPSVVPRSPGKRSTGPFALPRLAPREAGEGMGGGMAAVWGRIVVPLRPEPTDYERDAARLQSAGFVTANCFCRRAALIDIGGLDETFTAAWREDSDLYFTLLEHGYAVIAAPQAVVVHPVRPAGWGASLRQQRKILFDALLYKKHRALYRRCIRAAPPWRYYAILASLALLLLALSTARPWLGAGAGLIWLVLTLQFFRARLRDTSRRPMHVIEMALTSALIPPIAVFWRLVGAARFRVVFLG